MRAAEAEKEGLTQVNIAAAATWMGSSEGLGLLKKLCREPSLSPYARQNAARTVFDKGDHACFTEIADMIRPSFDPGTRIGALYLLSQLHDRTEEETKLVLERLVVALSDPESRMRLEGSVALTRKPLSHTQAVGWTTSYEPQLVVASKVNATEPIN